MGCNVGQDVSFCSLSLSVSHPPASFFFYQGIVKGNFIILKKIHFRKMNSVLKKSLLLESMAYKSMSKCATGFATTGQTVGPSDVPSIPLPWHTPAMQPSPKALSYTLCSRGKCLPDPSHAIKKDDLQPYFSPDSRDYVPYVLQLTGIIFFLILSVCLKTNTNKVVSHSRYKIITALLF